MPDDTGRLAAVFAAGVAVGAVFARMSRVSRARLQDTVAAHSQRQQQQPTKTGLALVRDWPSFEQHSAKLSRFIVDYYTKTARALPVRAQVEPGYLAARLPAGPPRQPESLDAILDDVTSHILPGITHWQHPRFFAYFPANSSYPGVLGDMLSDCFNCIAFSWVASPAATELETIVLDWLAQLCGLPEAFLSRGRGGGVIQGSASEAVVVALVAARCREVKRVEAVGDEVFEHGARCVVYASDQAHSATHKACNILNLRFHKVASEPGSCRMSAAALEAAIEEDARAGRVPLACVATVGTTSSGAVDPVEGVGRVCERHGMWLHIDAAWAGSASVCPEHQGMWAGAERADSIDFNVHKWMLTNFDCSTMWVKDRSALVDALGLTPVYLRSREHDEGLVQDYRDWQVPLGRRMRSLKLWLVLRMFGVEAIQAHIRENISQAQRFERHVLADDRFELAAESYLGLVCFRLKGDNALSEQLLERVNATGKTFLVHTVLHGVYTLRFATGNPLTEDCHVDETWEVLQEEAAGVLSSSSSSS